MSINKHIIFKVKITNNENLTLDEKAQKTINEFLANPNNIYINHSSSIITKDIEEYGSIKTINEYLIISLVYKDLNDSTLNLTNVSNKIKEVVSKEVKSGKQIEEPQILTDFEKSTKHLKKVKIDLSNITGKVIKVKT